MTDMLTSLRRVVGDAGTIMQPGQDLVDVIPRPGLRAKDLKNRLRRAGFAARCMCWEGDDEAPIWYVVVTLRVHHRSASVGPGGTPDSEVATLTTRPGGRTAGGLDTRAGLAPTGGGRRLRMTNEELLLLIQTTIPPDGLGAVGVSGATAIQVLRDTLALRGFVAGVAARFKGEPVGDEARDLLARLDEGETHDA